MKNNLKYLFLATICLIATNSTIKVAQAKASKVNTVNVVKTKNGGIVDGIYQNVWIINGTTKAPDGSKIIAAPMDKYGSITRMNASENVNSGGWAKSKHHKFKLEVNPSLALTPLDEGSIHQFKIFAVTNYNKKKNTPPISSKIIKNADKKVDPISLTVSKKQAEEYQNK